MIKFLLDLEMVRHWKKENIGLVLLLLLAEEMENKNRSWDGFKKLHFPIVFASKFEQKITKMTLAGLAGDCDVVLRREVAYYF